LRIRKDSIVRNEEFRRGRPLAPSAAVNRAADNAGNNNDNDDTDYTEELKDFKWEAAGLFGNIRIPAALFAGAGAAFGLPVTTAHDDSLELRSCGRRHRDNAGFVASINEFFCPRHQDAFLATML